MILAPEHHAASVCHLETIGRETGLPREIEIWFAADGDRLYLLSGGRDDAHWVRNLRVEPRVRIRFGRQWYEGVARELEGDPDEAHARETLAAKYQDWRPGRALSTWAATSLPVVIDLSK